VSNTHTLIFSLSLNWALYYGIAGYFHKYYFKCYSPNRAKDGTQDYIGNLARSRQVSYPLFFMYPWTANTFYDTATLRSTALRPYGPYYVLRLPTAISNAPRFAVLLPLTDRLRHSDSACQFAISSWPTRTVC